MIIFDKRKKYILTIDVETAGEIDNPICYDVGYAITDKSGKVYFKRHYVVHEVFNLMTKLMESAYYAWKIPLYKERIKSGEVRVKRFIDIYYEIREVMKRAGINTVAAYNCHFDRNALNNTLRIVTFDNYKWFFPYETNFICIWHMACQVICTQKTYLQWAARMGLESAKGNMSTSAETVYKYLSGENGFVEEHMGLDDVLIEAEIMARCFRQHKKMKQTINRLCWRIPQNAYKEVKAVR